MSPVVLVAAPMEKAAGGSGNRWLRSFPELDGKRHEAIEALQSYLRRARNHADRLLGKQGLEQAVAKNLALLDAPTMPALERYLGGPFGALADPGHSAELKQKINQQVIAISGLWGLVRLDDPLPDYHLYMNQQLPPLRRLNTWWSEDLTAALDPLTTNEVVWDFLPLFYRRAWIGEKPRIPGLYPNRPPTRPSRVIEVKMQTAKGLAIRNDAPDARGEVAAYVVEHGLTTIEGLEGLNHSQGFEFVRRACFVKDTYSTAVFRKKT